jgi:von Willebrand factor type A domain/WD40-like Beta Propeller Repeat
MSLFYIPQYLVMAALLIAPLGLAAQRWEGLRENLGPAVNNDRDQLVPVFSPGGDTLFLSEDGPDGLYRPYYSVRDGRGNWSAKQLCTGLHAPTDGSQYIFGASGQQQFLVNGIFEPGRDGGIAQRKGLSLARIGVAPAQWRPLPFDWFDARVNGRFANAFVHRPSRTLWLSFAEGADKDLYVCVPENPAEPDWNKLRWGAPARLPDLVNSGYDDTTPFVSEDGQLLYFASNRPGGYGAEDIYVAQRAGAGWLDWKQAENVGFEVNSNKAELYFTLAPGGREAFFVSYKYSMGAGDLFRIRVVPPPVVAVAPPPLPAEALPEALYKPNNIVFLLDHSNSMNKGERMAMLRAAMGDLANQLRPVDKVVLLGFGDSVFHIYQTQSIRNRDTLQQMLGGLRAASARTNGSAALLKGYQMAEQRFIRGGNNEVFLITDGLFQISPAVEMMIQSQPQLLLTVVVIDQTEGGDQIMERFKKMPRVQTLKIADLARDRHLLLENVRRNSVR